MAIDLNALYYKGVDSGLYIREGTSDTDSSNVVWRRDRIIELVGVPEPEYITFSNDRNGYHSGIYKKNNSNFPDYSDDSLATDIYHQYFFTDRFGKNNQSITITVPNATVQYISSITASWKATGNNAALSDLFTISKDNEVVMIDRRDESKIYKKWILTLKNNVITDDLVLTISYANYYKFVLTAPHCYTSGTISQNNQLITLTDEDIISANYYFNSSLTTALTFKARAKVNGYNINDEYYISEYSSNINTETASITYFADETYGGEKYIFLLGGTSGGNDNKIKYFNWNGTVSGDKTVSVTSGEIYKNKITNNLNIGDNLGKFKISLQGYDNPGPSQTANNQARSNLEGDFYIYSNFNYNSTLTNKGLYANITGTGWDTNAYDYTIVCGNVTERRDYTYITMAYNYTFNSSRKQLTIEFSKDFGSYASRLDQNSYYWDKQTITVYYGDVLDTSKELLFSNKDIDISVSFKAYKWSDGSLRDSNEFWNTNYTDTRAIVKFELINPDDVSSSVAGTVVTTDMPVQAHLTAYHDGYRWSISWSDEIISEMKITDSNTVWPTNSSFVYRTTDDNVTPTSSVTYTNNSTNGTVSFPSTNSVYVWIKPHHVDSYWFYFPNLFFSHNGMGVNDYQVVKYQYELWFRIHMTTSASLTTKSFTKPSYYAYRHNGLISMYVDYNNYVGSEDPEDDTYSVSAYCRYYNTFASGTIYCKDVFRDTRLEIGHSPKYTNLDYTNGSGSGDTSGNSAWSTKPYVLNGTSYYKGYTNSRNDLQWDYMDIYLALAFSDQSQSQQQSISRITGLEAKYYGQGTGEGIYLPDENGSSNYTLIPYTKITSVDALYWALKTPIS